MMTWQITFYLVSIWFTGLLSAGLAVYAWRQRTLPGSRAYARLALAEFALALAESLSFFSASAAGAWFWFQVRYLAGAFTAVFWLVFALEYSGRQAWLSKRFWIGLFILPFLTQVLLWTNSFHGLWAVQDVGFDRVGAFLLADISQRVPSLGFLIHAFYTLFLTLAGISILLLTSWKLRREFASQAALLVLGGLTAFFFTVNALFNLLPRLEFNPFTPGLGLGVILIALAVFRYHFLQRVPSVKSLARLTHLPTSERSSLALFLLILLLIVTGLSAGAYLSYINYERQYRAQVEQQLASIVQIKSNEIQDWRAERLGNGEILHRNPAFAALFQAYLAQPASDPLRAQLQAWLDSLKSTYRYQRVFLLDAEGAQRLVSPASAAGPVPDSLAAVVRPTLSADQVVFFDFDRDPHNNQVYLAVLAPIYSTEVPRRALGLVVLQIDPAVDLYSFLEQWPVSSQTAETLLVRREGAEILYLNPLRFNPGAALELRMPVDETELLAAKAVSGQRGIVEGRDYRGEAVIGDLSSIPNSPWFLVGRMDLAEVYAPVRERLWQTIIFYAAILSVSATILFLFWRQQRLNAYRSQLATLEALHQSEQKYRSLFDEMLSGLAVHEMLFDEAGQPVDYRFLAINPAFERMTGLRAADILGKTVREVMPETEPIWIKNYGEVVRTRQPAQFENYSSVIEKYFEVRAFSPEPGSFATIINDITERKQAEVALQESARVKTELLEKLNEAQHLAMLGSWEWDLATNQVWWSDEIYRIFGVSQADFNPSFETNGQFIHPEDRERYRQAFETSRQTGAPLALELRLIDGAGSLKYCFAMGKVVSSEAGQTLRFTGTLMDITARKETEAALQKSNQRFEALLSQAPFTGVIYRLIYDQAGQMVDWEISNINRLGAASIGQTVETAIGKRALELFGEQVMAPYFEIARQVVASGQPQTFETYFAANDQYYLASAFMVDTDHYANMSVDITARKRAEEALRESENKYRALVDNMEVGVVAHAPDTRILFANPRASELLWLTEDQLLGKTALDPEWCFIREDGTRAPLEEYPVNQALASAEPISNLILGILHPERPAPTWVHCDAHKILSLDGRLQQVVVTFFDITARKQAEDAVKESEKKYRQLHESLMDGFVSVDMTGKFLECNEIFLKMLGYSNAELVNLSYLDLTPEKWRTYEAEIVENQILKRGYSEIYEKEYRRKDGTIFPVELHTVLARDEQGRPTHMWAIARDITARKQADAALRESEARLKLAQQSSNAGWWDWDMLTGQLNWAPELFGLFGLDPETDRATFEIWTQVMHPDDRCGAAERLDLAIKNGTFLDSEYRIIQPNGQLKWIKAMGRASYDQAQQPVRMAGICLDITERKQADEKLRESEKRYRLISENSADVIWTLDLLTQKFTYVSPSVFNLRGMTPAEVMAEPMQASMTPASFQDVSTHLPGRIAAFLAGNSSARTRTTTIDQVRKDGSIVPTEVVTSLLTDAQGQVVEVLGVTRDITERRWIEAALRASEEKFRQAFNTSPIAISITRVRDGSFVSVNKSFEQLSGYSETDTIGKTAADLNLWENPQIHQALLAELRAKGEVRDCETPILTRNGEVYCLTSASLIEINGETHILTLAVDITERKRAEEKLAEYSTHLAEMVDERTRELREAQDKLVRQERLAVMGQLAGSVSHELRNPLGVISNAVYYLGLAQPQADPKIREYLEIIQTETRIADKIVADLLNYARLKSAECEPVVLENLLLRTMERYPAPEAVEVTLKIPRNLPQIWVDPSQILRVLGNLLVNAYQAMENRGELVLRAQALPGKNLVSIAIEDAGCGISSENLAKIFEPLFTTKARGIGLGLAICKNLVESNGGRIEVVSEFGKGSTFTVYLPSTKETG